jgi:hypothetical protein
LPTVVTTWIVLAAVAAGLGLLGLTGIVLGLTELSCLRRDQRVVEAAERLEHVDLSYVVQRYLPLDLRSQSANQEIPLIKEAIALRQPRRRRMAVLSGVLLLCAAPAAVYFQHRNREEEALRLRQPFIRVNVNALSAIPGVWGWKSDDEQSCQQNPQTVTVSADRKTIRVDYAKPHDPEQHLRFRVLSTPPNTIEMKPADAPDGDSFTVTISFLDTDTYTITNSQFPMASTGSIERCAPASAK